MAAPAGTGPALAGIRLPLLAWPVLLLFFVSPCSAWLGQGENCFTSFGLSTYHPSLKEVRQTLERAGGGKLVLRDDYRGESVYLAVSLAQKNPPPGTLPSRRELSYRRYRARAASEDFTVEIEKFTGALVRPFKTNPQAKLHAYWGGGVDLIRMKREGALAQRGTPALTQKDWLWGLSGFAGLAYDLSPQLSLDLRYLRDFVPTTTFNSTEYQLGGQGLLYALGLRF
jgi:hypothetical protein